MAGSGDTTEAVAGAIGLARVSLAAVEEREMIENFFNRLVEAELPMEALAVALLSGGSPPHIFLQAFITSHLLSPENCAHPFYWSLFSSYVRHPCSSEVVGSQGSGGNFARIKYLAQCNPLLGASGMAGDGGHWFAALAEFKGEGKKGAATRTEIASVAKLLRADFGKGALRSAVRSLCLDEAFEEELSGHPALRQGPAPALDHLNPSSEAIKYFSGSDSVSRVWRFYSPLLVKPWLMESGDGSFGALEYLGKLLCGMIPGAAYSGKHSGLVARLAGGHPLSGS